MKLTVGDILSIFCPMTGYDKYHVCVYVGMDGDAHKFLFLNSDPNYSDTLAVPCEEIPCLPVSETGVSVFSFSMLPRYTDHQLVLYKAKTLGRLNKVVAQKAKGAAEKSKAFTRQERMLVIAALDSI
jgi:hypothetical protein